MCQEFTCTPQLAGAIKHTPFCLYYSVLHSVFFFLYLYMYICILAQIQTRNLKFCTPSTSGTLSSPVSLCSLSAPLLLQLFFIFLDFSFFTPFPRSTFLLLPRSPLRTTICLPLSRSLSLSQSHSLLSSLNNSLQWKI